MSKPTSEQSLKSVSYTHLDVYKRQTINSHLDLLKSQVLGAEKTMQRAGENLTAESIKNKLNGIDEREKMLIPIFQNHNDQMQTLVGQEYAPGTVSYTHLDVYKRQS